MTKFAERQFSRDFAGTKIINHLDPQGFESYINLLLKGDDPPKLVDGYAPFCKHIFIEGMKGITVGVTEITRENEKMLKSGYRVRNTGELPVLTRWFEMPNVPDAEWLDVILYNKEQLEKEGALIGKNYDYGIVSINGVPTPEETPMLPMTMLRNALGISYGGSGVSLDVKAYLEAVEYWNKYAIVMML